LAKFRHEEALFSEEDNLVYADHFHNELFDSKLTYLGVGDIFFINSAQFMQGNDTKIIVATGTTKAFIGKLGL
jgi:hypothetical protein